MARLPDKTTVVTNLYARRNAAVTIAQSVTTSAPHIFSTGDIEAAGNLVIDGTSTLTGNNTSTGTLTQTGASTFTGAATFNGGLSVATGATNVGQGFTGDVTSIPATGGIYTVLSTDFIVVAPAAMAATGHIMIPSALCTAGNIFIVITRKGATTAMVIDVAAGTIGGAAAGTGITCTDAGCYVLIPDGTNYGVAGWGTT